jgi:DNA-binding MarR family transcriptional regulator
MKRDFETIRAIMLAIENSPTEESPDILKSKNENIKMHVNLLHNRGFITSSFNQGNQEVSFARLTWKGYEFLEKIKNDGIWEITKRVSEETHIRINETMIDEVFAITTDGMVKDACITEMRKAIF